MLPELTGIGAMPPARASLASLEKRWAPAISPISLPAVSGPKPGSASSCGATWATSSAISASSALMVCGELAQVAQLVAGDPDPRGLLGAGQAPARSVVVHFFDSNAQPGKRLLGPEVVQVPEQVVVERGAHPDEPFAVIDQQPDVELDAGQLGDRQPLDALAQRRAGDGDRVDAVGLAALAAAAALAGHQPGRDPDDALAADEQEPLEGARDMPAVLQRPHPLVAQAARPIQRRGEPALADRDRSCRPAARRCPRRPRRSCASACACPHRARS